MRKAIAAALIALALGACGGSKSWEEYQACQESRQNVVTFDYEEGKRILNEHGESAYDRYVKRVFAEDRQTFAHLCDSVKP